MDHTELLAITKEHLEDLICMPHQMIQVLCEIICLDWSGRKSDVPENICAYNFEFHNELTIQDHHVFKRAHSISHAQRNDEGFSC